MGNMTEVRIVGGQMDEAMPTHGRNDERVIGEQMVTLAKLTSQHELRPSEREHTDAQRWDLSDELARQSERREMFGMAAEQIQSGFRGSQTESLDRLSQAHAVKDLSQDDGGGDSANLACPNTMKEQGAARTGFQRMVQPHVGVQEQRLAGGGTVRTLTDPRGCACGGW